MDRIGDFVLPVAVALILTFAFARKVPVFDVFLEGAKDGLISVFKIAPSVIGLVVAVAVLNASGFFNALAMAIAPVADFFGFPTQVLPLMLLRPVSGSGSLALLDSILTGNGANSFAGRVASVMMGSTETTFYAIAVYYGAAGITKIRHTAIAALCADFTGAVMAVLTVNLFFS